MTAVKFFIALVAAGILSILLAAGVYFKLKKNKKPADEAFTGSVELQESWKHFKSNYLYIIISFKKFDILLVFYNNLNINDWLNLFFYFW